MWFVFGFRSGMWPEMGRENCIQNVVSLKVRPWLGWNNNTIRERNGRTGWGGGGGGQSLTHWTRYKKQRWAVSYTTYRPAERRCGIYWPGSSVYHMDLVALNAGAGSRILTQGFPPEVGTAKMCTRMIRILGNTQSQFIAHSDKNVM
jgi:hypothetical protein